MKSSSASSRAFTGWSRASIVVMAFAFFGAAAPGAAPAAPAASLPDAGAVSAFATADSPPPAGVPPRPRAVNDESAVRHLVLDNGMRVLLVSDPRLNKSAASVAVGAGSLDDPESRDGLAHFLEHMLFLGTEKYPDAGSYQRFIEANNGAWNAYTAGSVTNYHFEVRHEAFAEALDVFAQFFIAPLFTPEFTEREINAVNSEFQMRLENDLWRQFQLMQGFFEKKHPEHHFNIGNAATLAGTTRDELLAFYRAHYSANRMALALTGKAPLDELERLARACFSAVENRRLAPVAPPPVFLPPKPALRLIRMTPVKDIQQLTLLFPLPGFRADYASKPGLLLGFILGHEGEGSLLSSLKKDGLATALSASFHDEAETYGSCLANITLTPAGVEKHQTVLARAFSAIGSLRRAGYPEHLFRERRAMARLDETFQDKGEGMSRAIGLANLALQYPLEIADREPYLWLAPDPAAYQRLLDALRPDNLLATLIAQNQPADRTEPWYGTRYSYTEDTGPAWRQLLAIASGDTAADTAAGLHPPAPNPYIPGRTDLLPAMPLQLIDEPALSLYYAQDAEFHRPMSSQCFFLRMPRSLATLEDTVLLRLYAACVREALNETTYPAAEAGLGYTLEATLAGLWFSVSGYDESAGRLLDTLAAGLVEIDLTPERYAALQDALVRELSSFLRAEAYAVAGATLRATVFENSYRPDEQLPVAQRATLGDIRAFAKKLRSAARLEALAHGNLTAAEAVATARRVAEKLAVAPPPAADPLLAPRLLVRAAAADLLVIETLPGNNSAFLRDYILGPDDPEHRAAALILNNFIVEPFFTELRTRQQLGYVAQAWTVTRETQTALNFRIQSGNHPADELAARADAFIATLPAQLAALTDDEWAALVEGARAQLEEKDKTIRARAARLFVLAYQCAADWARREETLKALDRLAKPRVEQLLKTALAPDTRRQATILAYARDHTPKTKQTPTFTDRPAWKKTQTYQ
ncbi:MAG: insulinase family protein [Opitutaceae bacterium]|nr:insulinase family protein [Opitutaceae bacterium]